MMRLLRAYRRLCIRLRLGVLESQMDHARDLLADHAARLDACRREHARLCARLWTLGPPVRPNDRSMPPRIKALNGHRKESQS
jgi:hypothetical protein